MLHVPFTLPCTINLAILLVVESESKFQIRVNSLALFLSLVFAEEKVGARRTMGVKGQALPEEAQLVFQIQASGLVSSR